MKFALLSDIASTVKFLKRVTWGKKSTQNIKSDGGLTVASFFFIICEG